MPTFTQSEWPADTSTPVIELTVGGLLRQIAAEAPAQTALTEGTGAADARRWTFEELLADAEAAARGLLARFTPGERVAVWAPNLPEWVVLEFATALAGLTLVTANPAFRAPELAYVLERSSASGLIVADSFRGHPMAAIAAEVVPTVATVREVLAIEDWSALVGAGDATAALPEVSPDDPAQIQFTSGTTGRPKGAVLRHRSVVNNGRFYAQRADAPPNTAWVNPMPMFHTGGCVSCTIGPMWRRMNNVLVNGFDPALVLALVEAEQASTVGGVPTMILALLEHPDRPQRKLSSLRRIVCGGATVPADLVRRIEATLKVDLCIAFGQTESAPVITMTKPRDTPEDKADTIGQPLPQADCRIVDPATGEVVPVGVAGEICVRSYQVMVGYDGMPAATAEAIDTEGFLHTGDLGSMDERGYFTVTGRLKDMIIRGGENLYPREIEERLFEHPAVSDVAVIAIPDDRLGERVGAVLRLLAGMPTPTVTELRDWCREVLAPYKTPSDWFVVDEFPLTGSGKVQKFALRDQVAAGQLTALV